jgi:hypothetical protein
MSQGLIAASIGKGLESFVDSYNSTRNSIRQQAESDETRALRRRQMEREEESDKASMGMKQRENKFREAEAGLEYDETAGKYNRVGKPLWQQKMDYSHGLIQERNPSKSGGKPLPSSDVLKLTEGDQMPGLMAGLESDIKENSDVMGPFVGRMGKLNPYDTKSQVFNSKMATAAQIVGKYMEGGVLRAEDVPKYRAMLPQITDTPEVAEAKRQQVQAMLERKKSGDVKGLIGAGYKAQSFNRAAPVSAPKAVTPPVTKSAPAPGATITLKNGKVMRVADDGDTLIEVK